MNGGVCADHAGRCFPDEENQLERSGRLQARKHFGPKPPWWFQAGCFTYSLVGFHVALCVNEIACGVPGYPWRVEASLLLVQGCLSFLHDSHFEGRSPLAMALDRSCATLLTCCQPLKFLVYSMDAVQAGLLAGFLALGLLGYFAGKWAHAAARVESYQAFHTLWHVALPLGGYLWVEYTTGHLPWLRASRSAELLAAARCL
mmetsp:Transcript_109216/g.308962  ORF Transcript_109216/g.308962 Transcript_109216/m.308962 type:complete len:202 (-) Transcript_109216:428-1033(-)